MLISSPDCAPLQSISPATGASVGASVAGASVAGISVAGASVAGASVAGASVAGASVWAGPHAASAIEARTSRLTRVKILRLVFISLLFQICLKYSFDVHE